jgi:hypothetical protein
MKWFVQYKEQGPLNFDKKILVIEERGKMRFDHLSSLWTVPLKKVSHSAKQGCYIFTSSFPRFKPMRNIAQILKKFLFFPLNYLPKYTKFWPLACSLSIRQVKL